MKKFMKWCALIALILLILGFALAMIAGSAEGVNKINEVVESVTGGRIHINWGNSDSWGIVVGENEWNEPEALFDISDNTIFNSTYEISENSVEKYSVGSNVTKLDIEVGGCSFYFRQSDDSEFYFEASDAGKFQCFVENNTIYVKSSRTVVEDWDEFHSGEIILYVPVNFSFEKVDAELGAGLLEIKELVADSMELEVGAGQITVDYLQADACDINVGMGEILVDNMQVTNLNSEVGMGHLQIDGTILGEADVECSMGAIELELNGSETDFNYTLEAAMGNVSVGGKEYSGLTQEQTIQNNAGKQMNIKCAMGNIEVDFGD